MFAIVAVLAIVLLLPTARFRLHLKRAYPGFRVIEQNHRSSDPGFSFDAGPLAFYYYTLESVDVPGFKLYGSYYTVRHASDLGAERRTEIQTSLFNGKVLTRQQSTALQRLWVEKYPDVAVAVGDEAFTGAFAQINTIGATVSERYAHIPRNQVYGLNGDTGGGAMGFFRLDPRSGNWEYMPDYLTP